MGEDEERLLEEEKSLWRRLGDGDGGNLGIAFGGRNEGFRSFFLAYLFPFLCISISHRGQSHPTKLEPSSRYSVQRHNNKP